MDKNLVPYISIGKDEKVLFDKYINDMNCCLQLNYSNIFS